MEKFKVLKSNRIFLNQIGISLDNSNNPTCGFSTFFFNYHVLISQVIGFIISAAFIWKNSNDIKPVLNASKICIAVTQCGGMCLGVRLKVFEAKAFQRELQQIVNKGITIRSHFDYSINSCCSRFHQ